MSLNVFPIASTASSDPTKYVTAASANTMYLSTTALDAGIYIITCPSGTVTKIDFFDATGTYIMNATTTSGTVTINLSTAAKSFYYWTNTGSNVQISLAKSGSFGSFSANGTVTTYTNSQTIVLTEPAYAVIIGAGGGGAHGAGNYGGQGGRHGQLVGTTVNAGSKTLVIGSPGTAVSDSAGNAGGSTIFAGSTATGGAGGNTYAGSDGNNAAGYAGTASSSTTTLYPFASMGTTGTGGGGGSGWNTGANGGAGAGSGVGTGGNGGYRYSDNAGASGGNSANGYGAGGGGGGGHSNQPKGPGGSGSAGVLYIIK